MSQLQTAYIVAAVRSPVGKAPRGVFKNTRPDDLLAHVIKGILAQTPNLDPKLIEDVIVGCAMPEAEQGMNVARIGALLAGLPDCVPGMTVNRFCSSGLQTVATAVDQIRTGAADVIIAAGTESMSMVPLGGYNLRPNLNYFVNNNEHIGIAYGMGITAENVAKKWKISRTEQDEFALSSHKKALDAQTQGFFDAEILPYDIDDATVDLAEQVIVSKARQISKDEGPRRDSTLELLNRLKPAFSTSGSVTAGNSSQMSDGAGAVLVMSERMVKDLNLEPIAQLHSFAVAGVEPELMGIGPGKAIPKALKLAGKTLADMDWIELNEAFAAQSLAVVKESDLDIDKINPVGGAIALGHPLGATGAIRTATLIHGLRRTKQKYGMVTMCIGTGMGAAGIFEVF
jgi:acetyl-CoA acyltransferase